MPNEIQGAWRLRSYFMENVDTKARTEPFGSEPRGSLLLHPDGRMTALITPGGRMAPVLAPAAGAPRLVAYSGRFRLEPPDQLVTTVDVASIAPWIGTRQARGYKLDGDRLDIFTPPGPMPLPGGGEATVFAVMSWEREAPTPTE